MSVLLNHKPNDTALLIFSRTAAKEAAVKDFFPTGKRRNLKITKRLIHQVNSIAKNTGFPYFTCDETMQVGNSFGERLTNAMEALFSKGFDQLVVIGNDSPALTATDIRRAADGIAVNKMALIPTLKGGISLLGINVADFHKGGLSAIQWQTENVFAALQLYASQHKVSSICFGAIDDVNNFFDLKNAINFLSPLSQLKQLLINLTAEHLYNVIHNTAFYFFPCVLHKGLRAPPSSVSFL